MRAHHADPLAQDERQRPGARSASAAAPASPPMGELKDSHRVFPGEGILPLEKCLRDLRDIGYERCVSLELYNPSYWERDPLSVAIEGREKTLAVIERALT